MDENTPISRHSPHHGKQLSISRAHWEHDLTLQDAKHSHLARLSVCYHQDHTRWAWGCSRRTKTKTPLYVKCNISESARRQSEKLLPLQQVPIYNPRIKREKTLSGLSRVTGNNAQKQPLVPAGHILRQNRAELLYFRRDTKLYTKQRDAGHHGQNWEAWAWCVPLLHFLTASNIITVTHNTRESNCCSDYLQPLH